MSEKPSNNGWKENPLKSSLALEQLVAEQLERSGFHVAGEFPTYFIMTYGFVDVVLRFSQQL